MALSYDERIAILGLREIYRLIGDKTGGMILKYIIDYGKSTRDDIRSAVVGSNEKMDQLLNAFCLSLVLEKDKENDSYDLSPFGKNVLELTKDMIDKIAKIFGDKYSILLGNSIGMYDGK